LPFFAKTIAIFDRNIGFREKRQVFRRKLAKLAENCDHNNDPWPAKAPLATFSFC
jgi:hypothetical protein